RGTGAQVRDQIHRQLDADVASLTAQVRGGGPAGPAGLLRRAHRSIGAQPAFASSARLLAIVVPGAGVATNEPELLGLARAGGDETPADRRRERGEAAAIRSAPSGTSTVRLEDAGDVLLEARDLAGLAPGGAVKGIAGEPLAPVDRAQDGVAQTFLIAGSLTL